MCFEKKKDSKSEEKTKRKEVNQKPNRSKALSLILLPVNTSNQHLPDLSSFSLFVYFDSSPYNHSLVNVLLCFNASPIFLIPEYPMLLSVLSL